MPISPEQKAELQKLFGAQEDNYKKASWGSWYPPDGEYACSLTGVTFDEKQDKQKNNYSRVVAEFTILDGEYEGRKMKDIYSTMKVNDNHIGLGKLKNLISLIFQGQEVGLMQGLEGLVTITDPSVQGPIFTIKVEKPEDSQYTNLNVLNAASE